MERLCFHAGFLLFGGVISMIQKSEIADDDQTIVTPWR
jgi:hypothetical protein